MKKYTPYLWIYLASIFLIISCEEVGEQDLLGEWQAIKVLEEGKRFETDVTAIKIRFYPTSYQYESTLQYKEAGKYHVQANLLITKDTLRSEAKEKAVEIQKITKDSLFLRMNEAGKERLMVLVKNK